jgi:hypothetical protein
MNSLTTAEPINPVAPATNTRIILLLTSVSLARQGAPRYLPPFRDHRLTMKYSSRDIAALYLAVGCARGSSSRLIETGAWPYMLGTQHWPKRYLMGVYFSDRDRVAIPDDTHHTRRRNDRRGWPASVHAYGRRNVFSQCSDRPMASRRGGSSTLAHLISYGFRSTCKMAGLFATR